jgi:signal transduction histidine kinase/CheY-like chemotaxis protein
MSSAAPPPHPPAPSGQEARPRPSRELLIEAEKIRTHYRGMPVAFIGIAVVATIVALAMPPMDNPIWMPVWVGAVYLLSVTRFVLWRNYRRASPPPAEARRWGVYATLVYGVSGVIWGAGCILLYPAGQLEYQLLFLFVALGAAMGAFIGLMSYMPIFFAFMYPLGILAALSFLREPDTVHITFSLLILIYLAVGTWLARNLYQSYSESITLRFENIELINDLRHQKAVADEANVAKSRFLAAASHDLRQPMHALGLFVQSLQESNLPEAEHATLANVRRSVDAMEELFNALLDVSKLDAGVVTANIATVPLRPIIERVGAQFQPLAWAKGLRLRVRASPVYVRTDPILLERILRNLVSNAVQHTRRGGVLVSARLHTHRVRVQVWDTGPGIPAEQHRQIFREFCQLRNPERDRNKGLGLGLAIVDRLARLLSHPVELQSRIGHGTVFSVTVPRGRAADYVAAPVAGGLGGPLSFSDALVCVVDDETAVQEGMKSMLRKWSCDVITAGSGTELLQKLATTMRVPDLIVSDYRLRDDENGIQVIEKVRHEFNVDIPAVLVTGDTGPERLRDAGAGGVPILHKPLNPAKLRTLMAGLLRHRPPA